MHRQHVYRAPPQWSTPQLYRRRFPPDYTRYWLYNPESEEIVVLGALDSDSPFNAFSPSVASGDLWIKDLVTTPDGLPLLGESDGTASYPNPGTRQSWRNKIYDISLGAFYATDEDGDYFTIVVGNQAANEIAAIPNQQAFSNVLWEGPVLDDYVDEPDGDPLTYDAALGDALPSGVSIQTVTLNSGEPNERIVQRLRGTPAGGAEGDYDITLRATDPYGAQLTLTTFTLSVVEGVQVPTVDTGSTSLADALEDIATAGFIQGDVIAQVNGATVGNVFDQSPEGGTYAPAGSPIVLYVSGIELPDVVGEDVGDAQDDLTAAGLSYTVQYQRTASATADTVISQSPTALTDGVPRIVLPDQIVTLIVARLYPISVVKTITRKRFQ